MSGTPAGVEARAYELTAKEFAWIRDFLYERTGIVLKEGKEAMVAGRLARRVRHHGLSSYTEYFELISAAGQDETGVALDLLTTNETYFFREPAHFDLLGQIAKNHKPGRFRVWSAASSSGEEAYTIAMVLADTRGETGWEIVGTDISSRVLERARRGIYPLDAVAKIPQPMLKAFCLRGKDEYEGYLAVSPTLTSRVSFQHANLIEALPKLGTFEVIFLRNVMIYFDVPTKAALVERIRPHLAPGGYLIVSHSESLNGYQADLEMVRPSVYRAPLET